MLNRLRMAASISGSIRLPALARIAFFRAMAVSRSSGLPASFHSAEADLFHRVKRGRIRRHVDAAHQPHGLAEEIVAEDEAFETEAEERGVHPHGLIAHVEARKPGKRVGDPLLPAGLHVGEFRIGNPRGRPPRQVVEAVHLGATGGEKPS